MTSKSAGEESGRGRLQREAIVQTALALMNNIGLDALSLRRLAEELHVQAPALYWHFKNKQELLDEMAETMLLSAYQASNLAALHQMEWTEAFQVMSRTLYRTLMQYRDGAQLMAVADVSRAGILSMDLMLGILVKAGFEYPAALTGITTLVNFTLGFAFEEQSDLKQDDGVEHLRDLIQTYDLKHLAAAFQSMSVPPPPDDEFESSIRLIIDGLKTRHPAYKP